jgi:hypothetical protein
MSRHVTEHSPRPFPYVAFAVRYNFEELKCEELSYASSAEYHDGLAQRYSSLRACLDAKSHYLFTSGQNLAWALAPAHHRANEMIE